jgi:hypothetical protein
MVYLKKQQFFEPVSKSVILRSPPLIDAGPAHIKKAGLCLWSPQRFSVFRPETGLCPEAG